MQGQFITIEGIDGAGKSTHLESLKSRLSEDGRSVLTTREPGGTALAEQVRGLLLTRGMDTLTEALLVFAARRDHLQSVIEPALARGEIVLCDRFSDATFAYQGAGRGMDWQILLDLEHLVQGQRQPDLTLWFDLPAEIAAQRRAAARDPDRFERLDATFFERVRQGYARRMAEAPHRFARIDADASVEMVWQQVIQVLESRGW